MIKINGEPREYTKAILLEMLQAEGYRLDTVAVERNRAIVPKADYAKTLLCDGDEIEIIHFVGGG